MSDQRVPLKDAHLLQAMQTNGLGHVVYEIARLTRENEQLRAALKPFAGCVKFDQFGYVVLSTRAQYDDFVAAWRTFHATQNDPPAEAGGPSQGSSEVADATKPGTPGALCPRAKVYRGGVGTPASQS